MLLPAVSADASYFVAEDGMHGLVIVAAAVTNTCRPASLPGPGVMIHVIAPCRNYGIGSELCDASMREARSRGMQAIYAARKSPEESEETLGWRRLGFTPCETVEEHQMPLDQFVPRLEPLMARLRRLGRIPPEARIVPLYEADREQVLRLHLDHLGGDRESLCQRLSGRGSGAFHARYSRVLLAGHQVVGCILTHLQPPRVAVVDANIVIPELRGGWANLSNVKPFAWGQSKSRTFLPRHNENRNDIYSRHVSGNPP